MLEEKIIFENEAADKVSISYPSGKLIEFVDYFCEIKVPAESDMPFSIIALPCLTMLITIRLSDNCKIYKSFKKDRNSISDMSEDKVCGILTEPLIASYIPGTHEFTIKFKPGAFRHIFSSGVSNLINSYLPADEYISKEFIYSIKLAKSFSERIEIAENFLLSFDTIYKMNYKFQMITKAIELITSSKINNVGIVAQQLAISKPTLNRYFKECLNVTPKQSFKILRFTIALRKYKVTGSSYFYEELGYTDFSHFVKDAKKYGNSPPSLI